MKSRNRFFCPICMRISKSQDINNKREGSNCIKCNSSSRERAVVFAVKWEQYKSRILFKKISFVIGVADSINVENCLNKFFGKKYINYHYHKDPKIDITNILEMPKLKAEIIVCSDVLEHVMPPVEKAFEGLNHMLKSGGRLVLSVPHTQVGDKHVEHFPILEEYHIINKEKKILVGKDINGEVFESENLTFHGGDGEVLEFRIFSETSLIDYLSASGFKKFKKILNHKALGIQWESWSRVWVAIKN